MSDLGPQDPVLALHTIQKELELYDAHLLKKPQMIAATKMDVVAQDKLDLLEEHCRAEGLPSMRISAATGQGLPELKRALARLVGIAEG